MINSVHEAPVFASSVGHRKVAITGRHSGPVELASPGPKERERYGRRRAKAALTQRRDEVAAGAGFLERLTLARQHRRRG